MVNLAEPGGSKTTTAERKPRPSADEVLHIQRPDFEELDLKPAPTALSTPAQPKGIGLDIVLGSTAEGALAKRLRLWKGAGETTKLTKTPAPSVDPVFNPPKTTTTTEAPAATGLQLPRVGPQDEAPSTTREVVDPGPQGSLAKLMIGFDPVATKDKQEDADEKAEEKKAPKSREISWEKYNSMSPEKRAAIDFNSMLVDAREKDLNADYDLDLDRTLYDSSIKAIFGNEEGSAIFAPEVVALLNKLKFEAPEEGAGSDLDDFLSLKASFKPKDIRNLDDGSKLSVYQQLKNIEPTELPTTLVSGTAELQKTMAETNVLLQDYRSSAAVARGDEAVYLGGTQNTGIKPTYGFGETETDTFFKQALAGFADPANDANLDVNLATLSTRLQGMGLDLDDFLSYAAVKSQQSIDTGAPLADNPEGTVRSPEEFRELLGIMTRKGKRNG